MEDVLIINQSEIELIREIGSGACGTVWLANYKGKEVVLNAQKAKGNTGMTWRIDHFNN